MASLLAILAVPITVGLSLVALKPSDFIRYAKWLISYIYIEFYRRMKKRRFDLYDMEAHHDPLKVGFLPPQLEYDMESPQPECHLLHAADEVFIYGVNSHSEHLIVRIARSLNQEAEAWIYLKLKDGNVYRLKEVSGYEHACSDSEREFTCGGLKVHYLKPMRRWRIFFHGLLRQTSDQDPSVNRMVYVKFALLWRASSDIFDMTTDINSTALASAFSRSKWDSLTPPLEKFNRFLNCYSQSGVIMGTVHVDGESEDHNLYLFGERMRFIGDTNLEKMAEFIHIMGQISKTGSIVHVADVTIPGVVEKFKFGFVMLPNGLIAPSSGTDFQIEYITKGKEESVKSVFHAHDLTFEVTGDVRGEQAHFESKKGWDGFLTIDELSIQMNSLKGSGVLIKGNLRPQKKIQVHLSTEKIPSDIPMVVHFSESLCQLSEVTGGKGSSLGKLTHLGKKLQNFIVPNGVVVTTSAYETFVNKDILKQIKCLEDVLYGNVSGDVKESCQRVMDEVVKANIPGHILEAIVKCLQKHFGEGLHLKKFAVRSSATGEDTEQMSAAGQMETFLGVVGLSEIMSAVKKCWASQFGFIAVQYKRQNGQILNSPMAVVIQEMVPCDIAGVLFTCDPLTGNPTLMSITANYGLGETVVSGSEEPDTITLARDEEDQLIIKDKIIGAKSHRIVIKDDEGTAVEDVSENEKNSCCLSDVMALRLGSIAVQIEKSYRSNRDIEWGFWNNNLYIFQSRPVTSGTGETDFEIDHEIDGPMRIENENLTVCNVGEVMPGALSPLGLDVVFKYFNITFQRRTEAEWQSEVRPRYFPKGITYFCYHAMFYTTDLLERISEGKSVVEAMMVGMFGRVIEDEELVECALMRYGNAKKQSAITKYRKLITNLLTARKKLRRAQKIYTGYHLPVEEMKDPQKVFDALVYACDDFSEAMLAHMIASQSSSVWNMILLSTLGKARGGINNEAYRDFAKLLACISDVESADVPAAMQSLAYHIGKEVDPNRFKKMDLEEIVQWLETSPSTAGVKFREFLNKHGHRCLKEFDLRSTTWGMDPKLLVQVLQNFVGNVSEETSTRKIDFTQVLSELDISMGFITRMMVKFLLPHCRNAVQNREGSKSLMVRLLHDWRKAYKHLAKLMVSEGRIPDDDLMFFMTLEEIKELLSNRSPKIISKANHRRRRYPILDKYIFPEIMRGFPIPVNLDNSPIIPSEDNFMMKGIPVSQGVAKGFVRVALTLEEAAHLKPGEILLTYSTDIGWSPYFPTLAGVVTELGGLISHGAVVSREYGLPCIAGLHGATRQFQTGDYVLLDGNKGILQKLSPPE